MPNFVLDASLALTWCFEDESTAFTDGIQTALLAGAICVVPPIWPSEVANGLRTAERRGRISAPDVDVFLVSLLQLPIQVVSLPPRIIFQEVLSLARTHGLTVYDASYLSLALRENVPLATLDNALRVAANHTGILLL